MNVFITILVTFFAGMGAGLGTGFAGMSAAAVISPMLITFLHLRYTDRIYLWICRCRRWNDDASDTDQCIGI